MAEFPIVKVVAVMVAVASGAGFGVDVITGHARLDDCLVTCLPKLVIYPRVPLPRPRISIRGYVRRSVCLAFVVLL